MIFGASSFAGSLPELKENVGSIELYIPKLGIYNGSVLEKKELERILDEMSAYCFAGTVHAPYFAADPRYPAALQVDTAKMGNREFTLLEESMTIANRIGAHVVVLHPGRIGPDREKSFASMVNNLSFLASRAEDYGVTLGLENKEGTDPLNFCCEAEELARTIEIVNSDPLKATFDIGHANLTCGGDSEKLRNFVRTLQKHIMHLHLHDNSGQWTEKYDGDEHMAPGKGCVDFSVLKLLSGYRGVYNLEVFSLEDVQFGKQTIEKALS
ncbi:Sugar phosphate isomerase/epimerase [Methanosarcina siciliae C2J]|uniref:Sugar phosphate isomerase/epimerase n=1 Tax=Methanosarcina siciliae C2J TaxID=1434118 RepID=A0A0E3PIT3_9EURY|nr:sugar phosphate isomerase/epimerase family protein [Methanosarcina siciliae]AKB34852.1 Sugar phosphate isomerase/epimerase [Methanosarcina siciliae C2J]